MTESQERHHNLGVLFDEQAPPTTPALNAVDADGHTMTFSYQQLAERIQAVAGRLLADGLVPGDRVGIVALNSAAYLWTYFGIMRAGLVAVPVNQRFTADTIAYVFDDARLSAVFVDAQYADVVSTVASDAIRQYALGQTENWPVDGGVPAPIADGGNQDAMVLYTSGSTGRPKGVPLSHDGQLWVLRVRSAATNYAGHNMLVAAPLCHMNALLMSKLAFYNGATVTLLPQFAEQPYLNAIENHRCTWLTSIPTMLARLVAAPELMRATDVSSVRVVAMGSSAPSQELFGRLKQWFPGAQVVVNYGSTEAGAGIFGAHPDGLARPDLSLGYPLPESGFRLVDGNGHQADEGELQVRYPAVMSGYLNRPDKTRAVFTDDGYYRSGDIMRRDGNGFVYFVSRADDVFKCNGETVVPSEIETLIEQRNDVESAVVVGLPDAIRGHVPVAFVVARSEHLSGAVIKEHVLANAPAYMHPRHVYLLDTLPLGPTGKVDQQALLAIAQDASHPRA